MSKGVSEVATMAMYVGITITAISGTLTVGVPALNNLQDAAAISEAENFMNRLDSSIQEVVSEGEGSTRTLEISIDRGRVYFDNATDSLVYELKTDASVISPQTSRRNGNIVLSSSANVTVKETTMNGVPCYLMENEHIKACIKKLGSASTPVDYNTSELLTYYEFKQGNSGAGKTFDGNVSVKLNGIPATSHGEGYTSVKETGEFIGTGQVTAQMASDYGFTYDVVFSLPTGSDFLKVDVQNFR